MQSNEFSHEEIRAILNQTMRLTQRGYFTGMNFVCAEQPLPSSAIVVHFLHDSAQHIDHTKKISGVSGMVVPRQSIYRMDPKYFEKPDFREEYKNALFYDAQFRQITLEDALQLKQQVTVAHPELDLLVPLLAENLEKTVTAICHADEKGRNNGKTPSSSSVQYNHFHVSRDLFLVCALSQFLESMKSSTPCSPTNNVSGPCRSTSNSPAPKGTVLAN